MEQKQMEKKMKTYLKAAKKAAKGSKRAKKKLRSMAENDLITVIAKKATNHPAWYTKLGGELIGLNFGSMDTLQWRNDLVQGVNGEKMTTAVTTDAVIQLALTATSDETIRVAAQKIVNELRLVSGANTIYDVDDMIDYLLNIRSIWAALTQTRRAIRCLNTTDPHDMDAWRKYLMMALNDIQWQATTATGFSEEFRRKAATTVNWLNTIVKAVRFMMPGNFSLFERTAWLFSNIFADGTGQKFGTKMMIAHEVPYYVHAAGSQTHTATTHKLFAPDQTVDQLKATIETMVTDFTTKVQNVAIAGDLMKAYGMQSFYDPGQINFDEKVPFIYDERALEQIANCDILVGAEFTGVYQYDAVNSPLTVAVNASSSISKPMTYARTVTHEVKFVNTEDNVVTPGETLSLTRLKASATPTFDGSNILTSMAVSDCGTEVVVDYQYIVGYVQVTGHDVLATVVGATAYTANAAQFRQWVSCWSMDDYGPMAYLYDAASTNLPGTGNWAGFPVFDFSNWAVMSRTEQRQFHKTAILSMLTPSASVVQQAVAVL